MCVVVGVYGWLLVVVVGCCWLLLVVGCVLLLVVVGLYVVGCGWLFLTDVGVAVCGSRCGCGCCRGCDCRLLVGVCYG